MRWGYHMKDGQAALDKDSQEMVCAEAAAWKTVEKDNQEACIETA